MRANLGNTIRVLVVDDSRVMRGLLEDILGNEPGMEVAGTARNGQEALDLVRELKPDVVTLDIEMPGMDGLTALQYIMHEHPVPVIMLSAMNKRQASIVMKALEMGAVDFIAKTSGSISLDIDKVGEGIVSRVRHAAGIRVGPLRIAQPRVIVVPEFIHAGPGEYVVAIGASTGGPPALLEILASLPRDIPTSVLIVQHMPAGFTAPFAERLNWQSSIEVREAADGDLLEPGLALIAPGSRHMEVKDMRISLSDGEKVNHSRPSVDVLMNSVAPVFRDRATGVLLTGMGTDGAKGLKAIMDHGGRTIAQDQDSCAVFGMPRAAIGLRAADRVVPLENIADEIVSDLKGA